MLLVVFICAFIMGVSLGLLGAGGAVLTIPIFVYLVHMEAQVAISGSLFVVCVISLLGGLSYYKKSQVDFRSVVLFGIPSVIMVWLSRTFLLPWIPDPIWNANNYFISKSSFLLILFSILLFFAAYRMLNPPAINSKDAPNSKGYFFILFNGLLLGLITGILGAGGGFLIVPALVLLQKLDFKKAAGTSLIIISINTGVALISKIQSLALLEWPFVLAFTGMAILGMFGGSKLSQFLSSDKLKPLFAYFILAMGIFILIKELY
ncbi:MAG: sulfite exporter TauE/SafE family protein [Saprospiraceae bacterium]|nr:sulfite exporter TauE/SafE family protein [Saprospiraceae bacterium]MBK8298058.1 sulfite exporter TauE/SafE family protein [Saprospiraceae bacterium]